MTEPASPRERRKTLAWFPGGRYATGFPNAPLGAETRIEMASLTNRVLADITRDRFAAKNAIAAVENRDARVAGPASFIVHLKGTGKSTVITRIVAADSATTAVMAALRYVPRNLLSLPVKARVEKDGHAETRLVREHPDGTMTERAPVRVLITKR